jgi:LmbE family N-acetylglucosaminyl deacetylase
MMALALPSGPLHVLCLGAHPDDIEIGCGGTLLTLAARPELNVTALVLTGTEERLRESEKALSSLVPQAVLASAGLTDGRLPAQWDRVKSALEELATQCRPDLIFAPRTDDAHQDHRLIGQLVSTAWRDAMILHYEIPKWDGDTGRATHYVALTPQRAQEKLDVLNRCFESQLGRDWWDDEFFLGLMRVRGVQCRARYAEAFVADKICLDLAGEATRD